MVNFMDDETTKAFYDLGFMDNETTEKFTIQQLQTQAMVVLLETTYSDRDLKFTSNFSGAMPVQAHGHLDGLRFYFRFRHNWGSLEVGPYVKEFEQMYTLRLQEDKDIRKQKLEACYLSGEITEKDYQETTIWLGYSDKGNLQPVLESTPTFNPHHITKRSNIEGKNPEDKYNGFLTDDEAYNMFCQLVDTLEDIPENLWLDNFTRVWIEEGRTAANQTLNIEPTI